MFLGLTLNDQASYKIQFLTRIFIWRENFGEDVSYII